MTKRPNPLIAAVDLSDLDEAEALARRLAGRVAFLKVGLELFTAAGPPSVVRLAEIAPVFLDLKLHDIPNTVERAARNAGRLGASLLTVHALGGMRMVTAAAEGAAKGAAETGAEPPRILAVTVLSSVAGEDLPSPSSLAFEAMKAGAAGVVVSGDDVRPVREVLGPLPLVVVPGIRGRGDPDHDQVRVLTPGEALERGADLIVVGRSVTGADDPAAAAEAILREIGAA
jgi:orotidine-5'-phosphate decarboxylase